MLHDDSVDGFVDCTAGGQQRCGGLDSTGAVNGYKDNLNCGLRIRGPPGSTINLHFSAMNLEGGTNGLCGHDVGQYSQIDCSGG